MTQYPRTRSGDWSKHRSSSTTYYSQLLQPPTTVIYYSYLLQSPTTVTYYNHLRSLATKWCPVAVTFHYPPLPDQGLSYAISAPHGWVRGEGWKGRAKGNKGGEGGGRQRKDDPCEVLSYRRVFLQNEKPVPVWTWLHRTHRPLCYTNHQSTSQISTTQFPAS